MLSDFAERTKVGGYEESMDDFYAFCLDTKMLDYSDRLDHWRSVFGDRITVRPMIRSALLDEDVVADFFSILMPDVPVTLTKGTENAANSSLALEQLVYVRAIHRIIKDYSFDLVDQQHHLGWHMGELMHKHRGGKITKLRLHKSIVADMQTRFAEDAARLDRDHLGGGSAMADRLAQSIEQAVDTPQSLDPKDHFAPKALGLMKVHAELILRVMLEAPVERFGWLIATPAQNERRREIQRINDSLAT